MCNFELCRSHLTWQSHSIPYRRQAWHHQISKDDPSRGHLDGEGSLLEVPERRLPGAEEVILLESPVHRMVDRGLVRVVVCAAQGAHSPGPVPDPSSKIARLIVVTRHGFFCSALRKMCFKAHIIYGTVDAHLVWVVVCAAQWADSPCLVPDPISKACRLILIPRHGLSDVPRTEETLLSHRIVM